MHEFTATVQGIKCLCRVYEYLPARAGGFSLDGVSPPEPELFDFELLSIKGKPMPDWTRSLSAEIVEELRDTHLKMAEPRKSTNPA